MMKLSLPPLKLQKMSLLPFTLLFFQAGLLYTENTFGFSMDDFRNVQALNNSLPKTEPLKTEFPTFDNNAVTVVTDAKNRCKGRWIAPDKIALPAECKDQNHLFPEQASLTLNCEGGPFTVQWTHAEGSERLAKSSDEEMAVLTFNPDKIKDTCWAFSRTGLRRADSQPVHPPPPDDESGLPEGYSGSGSGHDSGSGDFTFSEGQGIELNKYNSITVSARNSEFIARQTGCADIERFCLAGIIPAQSVLNTIANNRSCVDAVDPDRMGLSISHTGLCQLLNENSPDHRSNGIMHLVTIKKGTRWISSVDEKTSPQEEPFKPYLEQKSNQQSLTTTTLATDSDETQEGVVLCQCEEVTTSEVHAGFTVLEKKSFVTDDDFNKDCTYPGPDDEPHTCHNYQILTSPYGHPVITGDDVDSSPGLAVRLGSMAALPVMVAVYWVWHIVKSKKRTNYKETPAAV